jgi:hypothetical protein
MSATRASSGCAASVVMTPVTTTLRPAGAGWMSP